jgi:hypothetical protein
MARALIAAMAVVGTLAVALPSAASAEPGAGLYAPFPQGAGSDRARAFFGDRIPTSVSADALRDGIVLPAGRHLSVARVDPAPSHRAGQGGDPDGSQGWLVGAAVAAGAAAGLIAFVLRRRPSEAH